MNSTPINASFDLQAFLEDEPLEVPRPRRKRTVPQKLTDFVCETKKRRTGIQEICGSNGCGYLGSPYVSPVQSPLLPLLVSMEDEVGDADEEDAAVAAPAVHDEDDEDEVDDEVLSQMTIPEHEAPAAPIPQVPEDEVDDDELLRLANDADEEDAAAAAAEDEEDATAAEDEEEAAAAEDDPFERYILGLKPKETTKGEQKAERRLSIYMKTQMNDGRNFFGEGRGNYL